MIINNRNNLTLSIFALTLWDCEIYTRFISEKLAGRFYVDERGNSYGGDRKTVHQPDGHLWYREDADRCFYGQGSNW